MLDDSSSRRAAYSNPPDFPEMLVWQRELRPGDLFIDVGADIGLYTIWALDLGARVIACEPRSEAVEMLEQNLRLNGYQARVVRAAVADNAGLGALEGTDATRFHLVVNERSSAPRATAVTTLDAILATDSAAGVKIDVEGAERLVLEGGQQAVKQGRIRIIQLEWNDRCEKLVGEDRTPVARLLQTSGYDLLRPDSEGRLVPITDFGYGRDVFARHTA